MKRIQTRGHGPGRACSLLLCAVLLLFAGFAPGARAAQYTVEVVGAGSNVVNIAQATPLGDTARAAAMQKAIAGNMKLLPFIAVIPSSGIPGGSGIGSAGGDNIDFKRFALANVHMLITASWPDQSQVEMRCFEVTEGRFMFGNRYQVGNDEKALLDVADTFCDDFLAEVIGRGDFFRSSLAFAKADGSQKRDIWSMRPNGRYLTRLTNISGEAVSPAWSPDGGQVIFTHIDRRSHGLGVYNAAGKTVQRIKFPGNTVIGPTYMPDGRVAVSLTDGRNPSIFLLNGNLQKERKLVDSSAIDVSPSVDATGSLLAFTSSRLGNPHIFLKDLRSGSVRRVSQAGSYNTDSSISPDGTLVVFARREQGGHRIFVHDLASGQERQLTFGPGSDEEPCFALDGYFIAFMSTRGGQRGLYVTTRNGGEPRRLPTGPGDAAFPAWGAVAR